MKNKRLWKDIGHHDKKEQEIPQNLKSEKNSTSLNPDKNIQNDFIKQMQNLGLETVEEVQETSQFAIQSDLSKKQILLPPQSNKKIREVKKLLLKNKSELQNLKKSFKSFNLFLEQEKSQISAQISKLSQQTQHFINEKVDVNAIIDLKRENDQLNYLIEAQKKEKEEGFEKYQQKVKQAKLMAKKLDYKLRTTEENLKGYSVKCSALQKQKAQLQKLKNQLEIKNNKIQGKLHFYENEQQQTLEYYRQIQEERDKFFEENRFLRKKLAEAETQSENKLEQELQQLRRQNEANQNQFYLKQMEALNEEIMTIREKYHEKNQQFQKKESILVLKEQQIEKSKEIIEEERQYLEKKEEQLSNWEKKLEYQSQDLQKEKQSYEKKQQSSRYQQSFDRSHPSFQHKLQKHYLKAQKDNYQPNPYQEYQRQFLQEENKKHNGFKSWKVNASQSNAQSPKTKKFDSQINQLDSRLKSIQKQMKKQIQQLRRL